MSETLGKKPKRLAVPQFTFVNQISIFNLCVSSYTVVLLLSSGVDSSYVWDFSFLLRDYVVMFCGLVQRKSIILIDIVD